MIQCPSRRCRGQQRLLFLMLMMMMMMMMTIIIATIIIIIIIGVCNVGQLMIIQLRAVPVNAVANWGK